MVLPKTKKTDPLTLDVRFNKGNSDSYKMYVDGLDDLMSKRKSTSKRFLLNCTYFNIFTNCLIQNTTLHFRQTILFIKHVILVTHLMYNKTTIKIPLQRLADLTQLNLVIVVLLHMVIKMVNLVFCSS